METGLNQRLRIRGLGSSLESTASALASLAPCQLQGDTAFQLCESINDSVFTPCPCTLSVHPDVRRIERLSAGVGVLETQTFNAEPAQRGTERDEQAWTKERVGCAAHEARIGSV